MTERNKDNTGVLFRNDRKENDKHPDRKGQCLIDGKEYWVAGWLKDGKNGQFLSLAFTLKDAKADAAPVRGTSNDRGNIRDMKDDIPF